MVQARGYCAPPSPTDTPNEGKVGTMPVMGGVKRKAVNLEGHFVPVSLQKRYKRLLARAVFENCSGVALSFLETPAMKAFTQVTAIFSMRRCISRL
jgi:hypothetical protein